MAANYRAVCKARSRPDFVSKMGIVEEEVDESVFWLQFLVDAGIMPEKGMATLSMKRNNSRLSSARRAVRQNETIGNRKSAIGSLLYDVSEGHLD